MSDRRYQTPDGVNAKMLNVLHQLQAENQSLRNTLAAGCRPEVPKLKLVMPDQYAGNRELYRGFVNQLSVLHYYIITAISLALNSSLRNLSGVYFNASFGSFICLGHGYAVKRASVANHMRTYHGVTVTLEDLMGFFQVNDSDFTDTFGFGPNDQPVAPYLGLQIMNKVYCSQCSLIVCGDSGRKDHQQHQTSQVHVQSVYTTSQNVSYFRVTVDNPEAAAADSDCAISRFIADLLSCPGSGLPTPLSATSADDPEMVSFGSKMSLAHFTAKNAEYLKAIDVTIQNLESARNAHLNIVIAYLQTTMADIPAMNYRLRQRVMPADSIVGLKQLADASTLKRYSDQFLSFLHFVLADSYATAGEYQMAINENIINDVVQVVLQKLDLLNNNFGLIL
ncbi:hypothetical protein MP228_011373 [Amoeboaphelidium protococcarum]|nr:hypothetical protein MP228_011373 [Amoeboaphelidium protococcarum]